MVISLISALMSANKEHKCLFCGCRCCCRRQQHLQPQNKHLCSFLLLPKLDDLCYTTLEQGRCLESLSSNAQAYMAPKYDPIGGSTKSLLARIVKPGCSAVG